jgi:hypothetical protein
LAARAETACVVVPQAGTAVVAEVLPAAVRTVRIRGRAVARVI